MILFVNNNRGILFLSLIEVVRRRIIEYVRRVSKITTEVKFSGPVTTNI